MAHRGLEVGYESGFASVLGKSSLASEPEMTTTEDTENTEESKGFQGISPQFHLPSQNRYFTAAGRIPIPLCSLCPLWL